MSDRAQALEAANEAADRAFAALIEHCESPDEYQEVAEPFSWAFNLYRDALLAVLAAPPVGVSPQPDTALKEAATWVLNVVSGVGRAGGEPEPDEGQAAFQALADALSTPDAQVCVWREIETAPKDGTEVLLLGPDGSIDFGHWRADRKYAAGGVWRMRQWLYVFPDAVAWSPIPPVVGTAPQGGEQ